VRKPPKVAWNKQRDSSQRSTMPTKAKSARRATAAATAASSGYATARRVRVVRPSLQFPLIMFT
jgi:hypothetical protein